VALSLVVGLGNPESRYSQTRHNVGFAVLDELALLEKFRFSKDSLGPVELARHEDVRYIKPLTYMNLSGKAVRAWIDWLKLPVTDLLVVVDDAQLDLGQIRLRRGGSHGGHNGLRSIEEELGTMEYPRLRCGVGPIPPLLDMEEFVLGRFLEEEQKKVKEMVQQAAEAVRCCQKSGLDVAMNLFNKKKQEPGEKE
jgi:PTH1 family peptidyl-tRNA hydrolase